MSVENPELDPRLSDLMTKHYDRGGLTPEEKEEAFALAMAAGPDAGVDRFAKEVQPN